MIDDVIVYTGLTALFSFGLILIAALVQKRAAILMVGLMVVIFLTTYMGVLALRGSPKALHTETSKVEEAKVLWMSIIPHKKILLVLTWSGLSEPRYYQMPWSKELEKELQQAQANAIARRVPLMMRMPGAPKREADGGAGDDEGDNANSSHQFYPGAPPPLPEKNQ